MKHVLDNPVRASLLGPHARFAIQHGSVLRYPSEVAPFVAIPDEPDAATWTDLSALVGPGALAAVSGGDLTPPPGWEVVTDGVGVQMVDDGVDARPDPEAILLGPADVPEILDLVARTRPGPFLPRTVELGRYLGLRHGDSLVAMAGERLHPPGWTEISAVCTDPRYRGRGFASRLVRAVAAGIRRRGETPLLHAAAANVTAIRLYETLGFRLRRHTRFVALRVPEPAANPSATPATELRWVDYADPLVLPMLRELDHEYGHRYGHTLGDITEEIRRERARFAPPDGGLVLLLEDGVPVSGGAFRRWDAETAELKRIWTDSRHRRRGLARRVLAELEREITARGYARIYLTTGWRQPEAQNLYLRTDYRPLYDNSLSPEEIGKHPFEKHLDRSTQRPRPSCGRSDSPITSCPTTGTS
jgi:predicted GNAT family acetyltransferase